MFDHLFNENMSMSEARTVFFGACDGKTKDELEELKEAYSKVLPAINKREMKLADEGWFID